MPSSRRWARKRRPRRRAQTPNHGHAVDRASALRPTTGRCSRPGRTRPDHRQEAEPVHDGQPGSFTTGYLVLVDLPQGKEPTWCATPSPAASAHCPTARRP